MASWSNVVAGTLARRIVHLSLGTSAPPMPQLQPDGTVVLPPPDPKAIPVAVRPLAPGERADVLERARKDAIARGVADPKDGNPIYDLCEAEHTILVGCLDPDSPEDAPRPFFDSIEQIRKDGRLSQACVFYLHGQQQRFEDECSPHRRRATPEETQGALLALGVLPEDEASRFFGSLGPALQWIYTRTLAVRHVSSLTPRSPSTSPSEARPSGSSTPTSPAPVPAPTAAESARPKPPMKRPKRRAHR